MNMWVGLTALGCASVACFAAGFCLRLKGGTLWYWLGATTAVLVAEVAVGFRHRLSKLISESLSTDQYLLRRPYQAGVLILCVLVTITIAVFAFRRAKTKGCKTALLATIAAIDLFLAEAVSLHWVDTLFYTRIYSILLVVWAWLALGCVIIAAATVEVIKWNRK